MHTSEDSCMCTLGTDRGYIRIYQHIEVFTDLCEITKYILQSFHNDVPIEVYSEVNRDVVTPFSSGMTLPSYQHLLSLYVASVSVVDNWYHGLHVLSSLISQECSH